MPTIFHAAVRHRDTPPCARVTGSVDLMTRRLVALNTAPLFPMSSFFIGNWKLDGSANTCTKYHMPRRDTGTTSAHERTGLYMQVFFLFPLGDDKKIIIMHLHTRVAVERRHTARQSGCCPCARVTKVHTHVDSLGATTPRIQNRISTPRKIETNQREALRKSPANT